MNTYSKSSQLGKVKKDNPKKMIEAEQKAFRIYIGLSTRNICQLCNKERYNANCISIDGYKPKQLFKIK